MNCVFNKATKKFTGAAIRWGMPSILPTEVIISLPGVPDNMVRLNNSMDGVRPATQNEINTDISDKQDAQIEVEFTPAIIALINALDPANAAGVIAQAKAKRKAEL